MDINILKSIFVNVLSLTVIDCSSNDIEIVATFYFDMTQLEYLHIILHNISDNTSKYNGQIFSLLEKEIFHN
jgi:hypothetical protein